MIHNIFLKMVLWNLVYILFTVKEYIYIAYFVDLSEGSKNAIQVDLPRFILGPLFQMLIMIRNYSKTMTSDWLSIPIGLSE